MPRSPLPPCVRVLLGLLLLAPAAGHGLEAGEGPDARPPASLVGRVRVAQDGFVRLARPSLEPLVVPAERLVVRRRGHDVPARLEDDGALVFLAVGVADAQVLAGTYELWASEAVVERRVPAAPQEGERDEAPPGPLPRRLATDRVFGPLASAETFVYDRPTPTWFLAAIERGAGVSLAVGPRGAQPGEPQALEATVYAGHRGAVALHASWGGRDLGIARADGAAGGAVLRWRVPAEALPGETVALLLRDVSPEPPPPPAQDVSDGRTTLLLDAVALQGSVAAELDGADPLGWQVGPRGRMAFAQDAYAALVGDDGVPLAAPWRARRVAWTGVPGARRLYAATAAVDGAVEPATLPPHPVATAGRARHVILAVPALLQGARVLAAHRSATGTLSVAVPWEDVVAHYGHGEAAPWVVRAFVTDLLRRPEAPLEYLVLAGDATCDRCDLVAEPTIPAPMARTMYNGATAADRLYALALDDAPTGGPSIGRLPFETAAAMESWVARVLRYETSPPADGSRRMMRFITSEARFGATLDRLIENLFRNVVTNEIPPAYDIEVTFASPTSPFLWPPPEFNDEVIRALNEGALFYTYVGHGFARGFDSLVVDGRPHRILHVDDVGRVAVTGTPPAMFVIACTTAQFDDPRREGIGEALLARPDGPVAYWGATRVCHPAFNALMGQAIARTMGQESAGGARPRLGRILDRARDEVIAPTAASLADRALRAGIGLLTRGADVDRLAVEGSRMYTLLGDPALVLAVPHPDLRVRATVTGTGAEAALEVAVTGPLPDGTRVHLALELPRNRNAADPTPVRDPADPAQFPAIRAKHDAMNDWALERATTVFAGGAAAARLALGERASAGLVVKAWAVTTADVHQGAVVLP